MAGAVMPDTLVKLARSKKAGDRTLTVRDALSAAGKELGAILRRLMAAEPLNGDVMKVIQSAINGRDDQHLVVSGSKDATTVLDDLAMWTSLPAAPWPYRRFTGCTLFGIPLDEFDLRDMGAFPEYYEDAVFDPIREMTSVQSEMNYQYDLYWWGHHEGNLKVLETEYGPMYAKTYVPDSVDVRPVNKTAIFRDHPAALVEYTKNVSKEGMLIQLSFIAKSHYRLVVSEKFTENSMYDMGAELLQYVRDFYDESGERSPFTD
jgi:hypothetical protein